jgi:shikimate dehydrogenase
MGVPYAEVIGDPVAHSRSPLIHKFWLEKLGIEGDYRAMRVTAIELPNYLSTRRSDPDWRGCNVTMPLKQSALPWLDRLDEQARKAQAANLLAPGPGGGLDGFNTDATAVAALLGQRPGPSYAGHVATYVQIIGAGGAARAAVIGAVAAGLADFDFFNRTFERAADLARWLSLAPAAYAHRLEDLGPIRNPEDGPDDQRYSHVLINASSMGMGGLPEVPVRLDDYYPDTLVLDMAYGAAETKLVADAKALGLRVYDGLDMLVAQAADAFRILFGADAPREHDGQLRKALAR